MSIFSSQEQISVVGWDSCAQILSWGTDYRIMDPPGSFRVVARWDTLAIQQASQRIGKYKTANLDFPAQGTYNMPWVHLALVVSNTMAKWYINGDLRSTATIPALQTATATNTRFRVGPEGGGRTLHAKMDEVLVYNRVLSDGEIRRIVYPTSVKTASITRTGGLRCVPTVSSCLLNGRIVQPSRTFRFPTVNAIR